MIKLLVVLAPDEVFPSPTLSRDILHQLILALSISTELHYGRPIHARGFPAFQRRFPRISREICPGMTHHITQLHLLLCRIDKIVRREHDRYLRRVVDLLRWHRPSVIRKISEALVGES